MAFLSKGLLQLLIPTPDTKCAICAVIRTLPPSLSLLLSTSLLVRLAHPPPVSLLLYLYNCLSSSLDHGSGGCPKCLRVRSRKAGREKPNFFSFDDLFLLSLSLSLRDTYSLRSISARERHPQPHTMQCNISVRTHLRIIIKSDIFLFVPSAENRRQISEGV